MGVKRKYLNSCLVEGEVVRLIETNVTGKNAALIKTRTNTHYWGKKCNKDTDILSVVVYDDAPRYNDPVKRGKIILAVGTLAGVYHIDGCIYPLITTELSSGIAIQPALPKKSRSKAEPLDLSYPPEPMEGEGE